MALDANTGAFITLVEAQDYVTAFRGKFPGLPKGFFAGSDKVQRLLSQEDCIGIRIYYGYSDKDQAPNLVIVGVDSAERDLTQGHILQRLTPCPTACDINSALY